MNSSLRVHIRNLRQGKLSKTSVWSDHYYVFVVSFFLFCVSQVIMECPGICIQSGIGHTGKSFLLLLRVLIAFCGVFQGLSWGLYVLVPV